MREIVFTRCRGCSPRGFSENRLLHKKKTGESISVSAYKHCFPEETSGCMPRTHQDDVHLLSKPSPLRFFSSSPCSPCSVPFETLLRSLADTSCMSPSCKRGVTRLTSIVLVDERAYRAMDRWASDDKDHGIEMGTHRVARPVTGDTISCFAQ